MARATQAEIKALQYEVELLKDEVICENNKRISYQEMFQEERNKRESFQSELRNLKSQYDSLKMDFEQVRRQLVNANTENALYFKVLRLLASGGKHE